MDLYWFWSKTQQKNKKGETSERAKKLFNIATEIYLVEMKTKSNPVSIDKKRTMKTTINKHKEFQMYKGQSKLEYEKNYSRIEDIINKTDDEQKQISLAKIQAVKILDEYKAINRAFAAKEMGHDHLFEVFFRRAYELGSVEKQEYREYQLQKLGL
jgi:ATP adenylyltransferase/5',5'''-P-1,P-4-tetraphosphate phosphorylase II